jgi:hypothetical protein
VTARRIPQRVEASTYRTRKLARRVQSWTLSPPLECCGNIRKCCGNIRRSILPKKATKPSCALLFVDRTGGRARRWCSMAVCGNRAKHAAQRERAQHHGRGRAGGMLSGGHVFPKASWDFLAPGIALSSPRRVSPRSHTGSQRCGSLDAAVLRGRAEQSIRPTTGWAFANRP